MPSMWSVGDCAGPCLRSRLLSVFVFVVVGLAVLAGATSASAATLSATTSNLSSVFASAQAGDTILLASGSYGSWAGGAKSGMVTLRPAAGATVTMKPNFSAAAFITLDGLTLPEVYLSGSTHDVSIVNAPVTGPSVVDTSTMSNNHIVFDHDTFDNIDACSDCYEGRLTVKGNDTNTATVGVTITNSHFGNGGGSDGIQVIGDAHGVQIGPGNEFSNIKQGNYTAHVDSIQLYGSSHTQIVGNWFHDDDTIIMAPDGGDHEYIADNVMIGSGYVPAVQLGDHDGTQFVHNTTKDIDVHADAKSSSTPSTNVVISNNIMINGGIYAPSSLCTGCTQSYNLFNSSGEASGSNTVIGTPVFTGGASPASYAGYALAAGSPGKGNASDGSDRGVLVSGGGTTPPSDTTPPDTTITGGPSGTTSDSTPTFSFTATESGSTFACKVDAGAWAACLSPWTSGVLPDGAHTFSVRATDAAGNVDATPATASFTVDTSAPNIPASAVWTAPVGAVVGQAVTLDASQSGGDAPLTCTWSFEDATGATVWETATGCVIQKTFTNADTKYVTLTVADANGDTATNRQSFDVAAADITAPDTSITSGPSGATKDATPTYAFSATETGSTFECRVDSGAWASCTSPWTTSSLADGAHTVAVRATDAAGNVDATPATRSLTVDTVAPDTTITSGPSGSISTATPTYAFTSSEAGATFQCKVDAGSWSACTSPWTAPALADGTHTILVRAKDAAGNVDATPATRSVTVATAVADTTPPDTTFTSGPTGTVADATPAFAFTATEAGSTFECRVDLGSWVACTSPWTAPALSDGAHTVAVRATDAAGNVDPSAASRAFIVDTTAPKTTIASGPATSTTDTSASFAFAADDAAARFECALDAGTWAACTSPLQLDGLAAGTHVLAVRAIDAVGNVEAPGASWTWTIAAAPAPTPAPTPAHGTGNGGGSGNGGGNGNGKKSGSTTTAVTDTTSLLGSYVVDPTTTTVAPLTRTALVAPKTLSVDVGTGAFALPCGSRCVVTVRAKVEHHRVTVAHGSGRKVRLTKRGRHALRHARGRGLRTRFTVRAGHLTVHSHVRLRLHRHHR